MQVVYHKKAAVYGHSGIHNVLWKRRNMGYWDRCIGLVAPSYENAPNGCRVDLKT